MASRLGGNSGDWDGKPEGMGTGKRVGCTGGGCLRLSSSYMVLEGRALPCWGTRKRWDISVFYAVRTGVLPKFPPDRAAGETDPHGRNCAEGVM